MSRKQRELRIETEARWPCLCQFLSSRFYGDWKDEFESSEVAINDAIAAYDLTHLQEVASEWWNWNIVKGVGYDPRPALTEGLGVEIEFDTPEEARKFMNVVYEKLIVAIRKEVKGWKP